MRVEVVVVKSARSASAGSSGPALVQTTTFGKAAASVERVVSMAGPALARTVDQALPTSAGLRALADEVRKAANNPGSVPHPELADPGTFWRMAAFPQAAALVRQLRAMLVEIAEELGPLVEGSRVDFEQWLRSTIAGSVVRRREDPEASRAAVIDQIAAKCGELHRLLSSVDRLIPTTNGIEILRGELAQARRKQVDDVARRTGVSREAAEVALRQEPPHRHQDLVLEAQVLAHDTLRADIAAMIVQLTGPIFGLGERMVQSYHDVVASLDRSASVEFTR